MGVGLGGAGRDGYYKGEDEMGWDESIGLVMKVKLGEG